MINKKCENCEYFEEDPINNNWNENWCNKYETAFANICDIDIKNCEDYKPRSY